MEEHSFYGASLCPVHCASLRRGEKQGEILQIREGAEVSDRCALNFVVPEQRSSGSTVLMS